MKLLKKLSIATAIGKIPTVDVQVPKMKDGAPVLNGKNETVMETVQRAVEQPLMRVIGLANDTKTGNSTYGAWLSFSGQFEATNILTGEVSRSGNLFLPDVATELLAPVVKAASGIDVMIGFDIGVKPCNNAQGYEYTVTPLTEPSEDDPIARLKASAFSSLPALPAPKATETAPAQTAATETAPAETTTAADPKKAGKK